VRAPAAPDGAPFALPAKGFLVFHGSALTGAEYDCDDEDAAFVAAVHKAIAAELKSHPRRAIAGASWRKHGATIRVAKLDDCVALIDALAPEHLQRPPS
jgi:hypothetical protein